MVETLRGAVNKTKKVLGNIRFSGTQYWPAGVLNQLEVNYHLSPKDMLRLGYLRRGFGRRNKNYVLYIYDKFSVSDKKVSLKDVKDIYNPPGLLLFKGSVNVDGKIHLTRVS